MRQVVAWSALALVMAACSGSDAAEEPADAQAAAQPSEEETTLAAVRQATSKYEDVNVALQEGYIQDPAGHCVDAKMVGAPESLGAMGVHYFRPDLLGVAPPPAGGPPPAGRISGSDGVIEHDKPEVLVYEPQADGTMKLVAVEYLVFAQPWQAAGNSAPPTFVGTPFFSMADDPNTPADEAHGFEPHHELHVWLYRDNPSGRYAEWNPNVSCANAAHKM